MVYEKEVRELLCKILENCECETIVDRVDLEPYGMDSLNCMSLVIALEEVFDIEILEEKLGMQFVRNVYDICILIAEVKNNG